jgi:hypothetical protein
MQKTMLFHRLFLGATVLMALVSLALAVRAHYQTDFRHSAAVLMSLGTTPLTFCLAAIAAALKKRARRERQMFSAPDPTVEKTS